MNTKATTALSGGILSIFLIKEDPSKIILSPFKKPRVSRIKKCKPIKSKNKMISQLRRESEELFLKKKKKRLQKNRRDRKKKRRMTVWSKKLKKK